MLRATKQGMWPRQLPWVEQTKCISWLLYLAPEYDLEELCRLLKHLTGVDVALRFCHIKDSRPAKATQTPSTKAIHIEVDKSLPALQLSGLERTYSVTARTFPLGIKMRLVPELQMLTNLDAYDNAIWLQSIQAKFLERTETHWIRDNISHCHNLPLPLYDTLRAMKLSHLMAAKLAQSLFHAISPMATKDGYLVRYLPQYTTQARAAIAKLPHQVPRMLIAPAVTITTATMPLQPHPSSTGATIIPSLQDVLNRLFEIRFTEPWYVRLRPIPQPGITGAHHTIHISAPSPSRYQLYHWLLALWQLFQNTAWDRWRYRNGITQPSWDSVSPTSGNENHSKP